MRTGIIVLARMSSTRLPRKVLKKLCGKTVLEHVIQRLTRVRADLIIVATTRKPDDDPIEALCLDKNWNCFRGDEENILERCIQAARVYDLDIIVRLGADSPLIDGEVINDMLDIFREEEKKGKNPEYMSNSLQRSFPLGLDADLIKLRTLLRVDREIRRLPPEERKLNESNVVPYIHQNPQRFKIHSYHKKFDWSHLRLTLDTPEDYDLIRRIYDALYPDKPDFLMKDVLNLLERYPDWPDINRNVVPLTGFWTSVEQEKLNKRLAAMRSNHGS